ncbi:bifunctional thymidylate/uridylate kinase [Sugiyamaella lignohabitans]|uniref:Thymidylate kinase n=1 Tax=Sugiyamaella lignohabitans TaxID=796027 RepID=A0A167EP69_9ASCO|nr:bifunctional thymidylate/uridylate kinase [Sugiyamaella lignohabitans]ANB14306.1 bifunctional thymidylate/uridylate kinase [Sugiyamaella lignohabitans]
MTRRAPLILIEGLDRAGKSSQCEILIKNIAQLSNETGFQEPQLLKFPDRTTAIGQMINSYLTNSSESLSDQAIHLLFSANRWEVAPRLISLLESGVPVVLDRYVYSGIAFSAAKETPGMTLDWCRNPDIGLPAPDLTIFLDVSEEVAQSRGGYGQERYEKLEFQRKVRQQFHTLATTAPPGQWTVVSADHSIDAVSTQILAHVTPLLTTQLGPIQKLK